MANTSTATYTAQTARTVMSSGERALSGVVFFDSTIVIAAGAAAADTVNLFVAPAGVMIDPSSIRIYAEDPGTTLTLDIGYADNPDAFVDGAVLSAGGYVAGTAAPGVDFLTGTPFTEATTVIATYATLDTVTTGQEIRIRCYGSIK